MSHPRRCYVHIGLQKTGTSFLQSVLWDSTEALRAQGVELLPGSRDEAFRLMVALLRRRGGDDSRAARVLDALRRQASASGAATLVITEESLSAADEAQVEELTAALDGLEVHVVVTARDLARQLPSVWQQKVKAGREFSFAQFVEDVLARRPSARPFWAYQDLPAIVGRWAGAVPAERVHVVTVPQRGAAGPTLLDRFCSVIGVDAATLTVDAARSNARLGYAQADLLRRVNLLGDPDARRGRGYERTLKFYLGDTVLAAQGGRPAQAPGTVRQWCIETAEQHIAALVDGGYHVVGSLQDLLPAGDSFALDEQVVAEAEVADAAARALAQMVADRDRDRAEIRRLRAELEERTPAGAASTRAGRLRRVLQRRGS